MNILLAVSGSVAAYKSFDLLRAWVKDHHQVQVILTQGAQRFVLAENYRFLGAQEVWLPQDDFSLIKNKKHFPSPVNHVELAKWCDQLVIAPLSANTLARLSLGQCDDLLSSIYLALPKNKSVLIAPAMNTGMWEKSQTQNHLTELKKRPHHHVISPESGRLVCLDEGEGKMAPVEKIFHFSLSLPAATSPAQPKPARVLITAGATISPLDGIRYLTNPSTGELGWQLSKEFLRRGHQVTTLVGPYALPSFEHLQEHPNFQLNRIFTAEDMWEKLSPMMHETQLFILTAAINDIRFQAQKEKIKKHQLKEPIPIEANVDLLQNVLKMKQPQQRVVAFAAETQLTSEIISEKLKRKPVDLLLVNQSQGGWNSQGEMGFGSHTKGFYAFHSQQEANSFDSSHPPLPWATSKYECAVKIANWWQQA